MPGALRRGYGPRFFLLILAAITAAITFNSTDVIQAVVPAYQQIVSIVGHALLYISKIWQDVQIRLSSTILDDVLIILGTLVLALRVPRMIQYWLVKVAFKKRHWVRANLGVGAEWRWYCIKEGAAPLARIIMKGLVMAAFWSTLQLVETGQLPGGSIGPLPLVLTWLDHNGDGCLDLWEIVTALRHPVQHLLNIWMASDLASFILKAKKPPKTPEWAPHQHSPFSIKRPDVAQKIDQHFFIVTQLQDINLPWKHRATADFVDKLIACVGCMPLMISVAHAIGLDFDKMLAFGGISSLAIGFAAQAVVSNFIAGLLIVANRPFMVGDLIMFGPNRTKGTVESIGIHSTVVMNHGEGCPMVVPNKQLSEMIVTNLGKQEYHRITETFHVTMADATKLKNLVDACNRSLHEDPELLHMPGFVNTNTGMLFDAHLPDLGMRLTATFCIAGKTNDAQARQAKSRVMIKLLRVIHENDGALSVSNDLKLDQPNPSGIGARELTEAVGLDTSA